MRKVLFVLSSWSKIPNTDEKTGWWMSEAAHPWKKLHDAGYEVDFVSPMGGEPPITGVDMNDDINQEFMSNPDVAKKLKNTMTPLEVKVEEYAAIHYVGGHGACWDFPNNEGLANIAAYLYNNGYIVSAVCHGPCGLLNIKLQDGSLLIKNKRLTAFTDKEEREVKKCYEVPFLLQEELMLKGAIYVLKENWTNHVEIDGRLITGQNPQSAALVGSELVKMLKRYNY